MKWKQIGVRKFNNDGGGRGPQREEVDRPENDEIPCLCMELELWTKGIAKELEDFRNKIRNVIIFVI